MCGLVFAGGKTSMALADLNIFEQFLQCDTYRGDHSTGVCATFTPHNQDPVLKVGKLAVDGFDFVKTKMFYELTRYSMQSTVSPNSSFVIYPKALFGHNRYATIGAVNADNAHPFQVEHITLAHNGTLHTGWKNKLPDGHKFTVDSHCVANAVAVLGIDQTLQLLDGAFCLIWHDARDNTMNIVRNDERPFHLWETTLGDWFGCSEEKMGDWLLTRGKSGRRFKRHFELEVGVQYVFDVSKGCELKEERKHQLPVFPVYSAYSAYQSRATSSTRQGPIDYYDDRDDDAALDAWWQERIRRRDEGSNAASQGKETSKQEGEESSPSTAGARSKINQDLENAGLSFKYGEHFEFLMYEFKEYPKRPGYGYVRGYIHEHPEFVEVHVHDVIKDAYREDAIGYVQCISGYVSKHVLTLIGKANNNRMDVPTPVLMGSLDEKLFEDQDFSFLDQIAEDDMPVESRTLISGESFTEREWKRSHHNVCSMCNNPIPWDEVEVATVENGYCFCGDCVEATEVRAKSIREESATTEEPTLTQKESYCVACGGYHGEDVLNGSMTHAQWTSLAVTCHYKVKYKDKFTGVRETRPILSIVDKREKRHTCSACGSDFPIEMMSEKQEDLCSDCYTRFHQATVVRTSFSEELVEKTIVLGTSVMKVTPVQWAKMNVCRCCSNSIPFAVADQVEFWGMAPVCNTCTSKLDESEN